MIRLLLAATIVLLAGQVFAEDDPVVNFAEDDRVMNAAIAKARDSLPGFWQRFAAPAANEDGFTLKLGISDSERTEHFWCGDILGNADKASCVINNEPAAVFTVRFGERVDVDPAIISDWMYLRDGLIVGGETLRVIISQMPADQAAEYKAMLADEESLPAPARAR